METLSQELSFPQPLSADAPAPPQRVARRPATGGEVRCLDSASAAAYAHLSFPYLEPTLRRMPEGVRALGVATGGEPLGLLVGRATGVGPWEVLSLCVAAPWRGVGIGTALVERFAREAGAGGAPGVRIGYTVQRSTPGLERVLCKSGFTAPAVEAVVYTFEYSLGEAPWLRLGRLPPPLAAVPWADLSADAVAAVRAGSGTAYPAYLDPLAAGPPEPACSLALIAGGQVAGWCIALAAAPDALLYASLFVREDLRGVGCAGALLAASVRRHLACGIPRGVCAVRRDNPGMARLADRLFAPYAVRATERRTAMRPLGSAAAARAREGAEA